MASDQSDVPVIDVQSIRKVFTRSGHPPRVSLADVSFAVKAGQTLAVVGESGAGKTTLVRCVAGLERPTSGQVLIQGRPHRLHHGGPGSVQMVFQNPAGALNPMRSIGWSVAEPLRGRRAQRRARVAELLAQVGIDPSRAGLRPKAFSGGQLQRVVIARAIASDPAVLLCDEPTSALDVSVQAQIVNVLLRLQRELSFAGVLVTHDLGVARALADTVLVLRAGQVLFHGSWDALLAPAEPLDPYVSGLVETADANSLDIIGAEGTTR
ncbi:ABC transporter ATP-binding protein [Dactylosporangium roseum]|uniref:ABC transporter ATP-binding protein n=1 Tax=Dactylosporangium roseum TaxID=47989 RepID=A0ABY5Z1U1_9ACTN|nr:dipeptide/oligopeptide/nickel ABC transporter ATP-binding protein [Dactylosporangium roseum]UWZ34827.1 ABC transporter ATP-binding protein [Dactylosporangium roseum]